MIILTFIEWLYNCLGLFCDVFVSCVGDRDENAYFIIFDDRRHCNRKYFQLCFEHTCVRCTCGLPM